MYNKTVTCTKTNIRIQFSSHLFIKEVYDVFGCDSDAIVFQLSKEVINLQWLHRRHKIIQLKCCIILTTVHLPRKVLMHIKTSGINY